MSRLASFLAGLIALPVIGVGIAYPESASHPLCINGHPARRAPDVSYGGLPALHGHQRDHLTPLELGGPDVAANVRYQRCDATGERGRCLSGPAADKDADEHKAGGKYCAGLWELDYARAWLAARWPVDAAHGYDEP